MDTLPICKARSKQSGQRCKNFASKGKCVCRIHGGRSCGPKTGDGKMRQKMGSYKHGMRSKEAIEESKAFRIMMKQYKETLKGIT